MSAGGGRIRTKLDFLSLITEGDESQNIRLFDGDMVSVGKSDVVLREQLLKAGQTNLRPQVILVYVSGRASLPVASPCPRAEPSTKPSTSPAARLYLKARSNSSTSHARAR